jgi:hypothetical protein
LHIDSPVNKLRRKPISHCCNKPCLAQHTTYYSYPPTDTPSPTFTLTPTLTSTPTVTSTSKAALDPPTGYILLDQFDNQEPIENNWEVIGKTGNCSANKQDGYLYMECSENKKGSYWLECDCSKIGKKSVGI